MRATLAAAVWWMASASAAHAQSPSDPLDTGYPVPEEGPPVESSDIIIPDWEDVRGDATEGELAEVVEDATVQRWFRPTGFVGTGPEFDDDEGPGGWFGFGLAVEERGPATEGVAVTGERVKRRMVYLPLRGDLVVRAEPSQGLPVVQRAQATGAFAGLRVAEYAGETRRAAAFARYAPVTYRRDVALDRRLELDVSLTEIHGELVLPARATTRSYVRVFLSLPGYRYVEFESDREYYNGARILGGGLEISQEFGPFGALTLEPYAGGSFDLALGALREKRFATDTRIDTRTGLRVGVTPYVELDGGVSYVVAINTERRGGNPATWRAYVRLVGRF